MHIILIILLVLAFAYSIALVVMNNQAVAVNLLFSQIPAINSGLVMVATIFLGILIGIVLSLLLFRVLQNKWEISRLKKELQQTQSQLNEANIKLADQAEKIRQLQLSRETEQMLASTPVTTAPINETSQF